MRQSPRLLPPDERDPREGRSAEIIDLATRNVLPQVTQRRPRMTSASGVPIPSGSSCSTRSQ